MARFTPTCHCSTVHQACSAMRVQFPTNTAACATMHTLRATGRALRATNTVHCATVYAFRATISASCATVSIALYYRAPSLSRQQRSLRNR